MIDAVFRHWMIIVAEDTVGMEVFVPTVQTMASFLYRDDSLLVLTWL